MAKREWKKFKSEKERVEFEAFVKRHVAHIKSLAKLDLFLFRTLQRHERLEAPNAMEIETDYKYFEFILIYSEDYAYRHFFEEFNVPELLQTLCHEIAHIATSEAWDALRFDSPIDKQSFYFERSTQITSMWLYELYLHYCQDNKIDINTGKQK